VATRALFLCVAWTLIGTIAFARQYVAHPASVGPSLPAAYAEWRATCRGGC
jgi:hypothetical protein